MAHAMLLTQEAGQRPTEKFQISHATTDLAGHCVTVPVQAQTLSILLRLILKSIQILGLGPGQIIFLSFLELNPEINVKQLQFNKKYPSLPTMKLLLI